VLGNLVLDVRLHRHSIAEHIRRELVFALGPRPLLILACKLLANRQLRFQRLLVVGIILVDQRAYRVGRLGKPRPVIFVWPDSDPSSGANLTFGPLRREGGVEGHRLLLHGIGTRVLGGREDALAAHRIGHRNRAAINNNVGIITAFHNTGMIRASIRV